MATSTLVELPLGARPAAGLQDVLLSLELALFFGLWLRERPRRVVKSGTKLLLFITYGMNLFGAMLWCACGVYMHLFEPLPTERTPSWTVFLLLGSTTPLLFPLVVSLAFAQEAPLLRNASTLGQLALVALAGVAYTALVLTGADLSLGGRLPTELWLTPWHVADGRSYGGGAHGIHFDLMSSYPCYRGDSMFLLTSMFLVGEVLSLIVLCRAGWGRGAAEATDGDLSGSARRLALATGGMLVNCVVLLYLMVVFGVSLSGAFDIFHAGQGLAMALAFFELRSVLRSGGADTATQSPKKVD